LFTRVQFAVIAPGPGFTPPGGRTAAVEVVYRAGDGRKADVFPVERPGMGTWAGNAEAGAISTAVSRSVMSV
jgi:hypothetical protein